MFQYTSPFRIIGLSLFFRLLFLLFLFTFLLVFSRGVKFTRLFFFIFFLCRGRFHFPSLGSFYYIHLFYSYNIYTGRIDVHIMHDIHFFPLSTVNQVSLQLYLLHQSRINPFHAWMVPQKLNLKFKIFKFKYRQILSSSARHFLHHLLHVDDVNRLLDWCLLHQNV